MQFDNSITFRLWGRYALFSDPITRVGGEKFSYSIPTYEALKGVCDSIYWKPTFTWVVDRVRIMSPIRTESKGVRPIKYNTAGNELSYYTYLTDAQYQVQAHFEWNLKRVDLAPDRNEHKHFWIAKRMLDRGGRRDIFLGTRECQGYVLPCTFGEDAGTYDTLDEMPFGLMLHGITYADEQEKDIMRVGLWSPVMLRGIINFIRPEECPVQRTVRQQRPDLFLLNTSVQPVAALFEQEGGAS